MIDIQHNTLTQTTVPSGQTTYSIDQMSQLSGKKTWHLEEGSTFHYLLLVEGGADIDIHLATKAANVTAHINVLVIADATKPTTCTIHTHLAHSETTAHVHIVTFLPEHSSAHIDGTVIIHPGIVKASGHLLEENIILGDNISIKTLPMLDVRSNDVSASHGARIEKLDAKKLFYAQSRGLDEHQAKGLLISGYLDLLFSPSSAGTTDMHQKGRLETTKQSYLERLI